MVYFNRWTHRHLHSSSCCGSGSCIALTPFCSCTWRSDSSQCSCTWGRLDCRPCSPPWPQFSGAPPSPCWPPPRSNAAFISAYFSASLTSLAWATSSGVILSFIFTGVVPLEARVQLRFRWFLSIKKKRKSKRALTLDSLCTWQELFSTTKNNLLLNTMLSQMLFQKRAWAQLCLFLGYLTWRHDHTGLLAYAPPSLPSHLLPLLYFSFFSLFPGNLKQSFWYHNIKWIKWKDEVVGGGGRGGSADVGLLL